MKTCKFTAAWFIENPQKRSERSELPKAYHRCYSYKQMLLKTQKPPAASDVAIVFFVIWQVQKHNNINESAY